MADTHSIGDVMARTTHLVIACTRCDRRGRLSLRRLAEQYGPDTSMTVVVADIAADCPRCKSSSWFDRCDPYCPEMPALFPG